jgi:hypothetical protein
MKKLSLLCGFALLVSLILEGGLSGQSPLAPSLPVGQKKPDRSNYAGSASCIE